MKGRLVSLRAPSDEDFSLIERWLRPLTPAAILAGDNEMFSADELRELNKRGEVNHLMIDTNDGWTIGAVSWRRMNCPGNFTIGAGVGDPELWNKGYGAEAVGLLIEYLFHFRNAHRVQAMTALYNRYSIQTIIHGDFVLEGILRDYFFLDGAYHDAAVWSMLRDEFYRLDAELKARNKEWGAQDLVPESDKEAARNAVATYLAKGRPTSFGKYLDESDASSNRPHRARADVPVGGE